MKIAELYAQLGFKVEGADDLKAFDTMLKSIAASARNAALAMKIISRAQLPKGFKVATAPAKNAAAPAVKPTGSEEEKLTGNTSVLQGLKNFTSFMKQVAGFGSLIFILKNLVEKLASLARDSLAASFGLQRFTSQTGLSRDELKSWELAAAKADVSQQEIQDQLAKLAQQATEIPWGQHLEQAAAGSFLGVNLLGKAPDILKQFGQRMQGKTFSEAIMFGQKLGIDPKVAYMMWANKGVVPRLPSGQALTAPEQAARLRAETELDKLSVAWSALIDRFVAQISGIAASTFELGGDFLRGYNLLLNPGGRPADWPLPRMVPATPVVHQTTVGGSTNTFHVTGSDNPQQTAKVIDRMLSDSYYGRPPPWVTPSTSSP